LQAEAWLQHSKEGTAHFLRFLPFLPFFPSHLSVREQATATANHLTFCHFGFAFSGELCYNLGYFSCKVKLCFSEFVMRLSRQKKGDFE
jgi:hypothetical protein